jgi:hypothetical protein
MVSIRSSILDDLFLILDLSFTNVLIRALELFLEFICFSGVFIVSTTFGVRVDSFNRIALIGLYLF